MPRFRISYNLQWLRMTVIPLLLAAFILAPMTASAQNSPPADECGPLLMMVVLIFILVVILVLIGICVVVGIISLLLAGILLVVGILTSSALVGIISRRPASAFKALFIQVGGAGGAIAGGGVGWLTGIFMEVPGPIFGWVVMGAFCGLGVGIGIAMIFNIVWSWLLDRILRLFKKKEKAAPAAPTS